MRISKGALLVVLAVTIPFIVELRVVFGWVGIELTPLQLALVGAGVFAAIILWALLPEDEETSDADLSNGGL